MLEKYLKQASIYPHLHLKITLKAKPSNNQAYVIKINDVVINETVCWNGVIKLLSKWGLDTRTKIIY